MFKWRLRACRVQAGLYQREAAKALGISEVWVGSANQRVIDVQESLKGGKVLAWGELKDVES